MTKFLTLFAIVFLVSCESDSGGVCSSSEWIGTYTIETPNTVCSDNLVVVEASSGDISLNAIEGDLDGCTFTAQLSQVEATLSGTTITFSGFGCSAIYLKN